MWRTCPSQGELLVDLKATVAKRFESTVEETRIFDSDGLEITTDGQLLKVATGSRVHFVKGDNHFVWPTVRLGHKFWPVHVESVDPKNPIELETISESPRVFKVKNFLSDEEVSYLIQHAQNRLERSHVGIGKESFHNERTSKTAWDTSSSVSLKIQHRAFDLVRVPYDVQKADAIQVIRYEEGQMYLLHTDYFAVGYDNLDPSKPEGTNRLVTIFMYLSDVEAGGGTVFPHSTAHENVESDLTLAEKEGQVEVVKKLYNDKMAACGKESALEVHPTKGDAILFYNQHPDGTLDPKSEHG